MTTFYMRMRNSRTAYRAALAVFLALSLIAMQFPLVAVAQDAPPPTSQAEEPAPSPEPEPVPVVETPEPTVDEPADALEEPEAPAEEKPLDTVPLENEEAPAGLTDDTQAPLTLDVPEDPKDELQAPESSPQSFALFAAPPQGDPPQDSLVGPGGPSCVIVSDEETLEGGTSSFEVSEPHHVSWTAVVDLFDVAKWIWGDDPVTDPEAETVQTFTRTFSIESDSSGGTLVIAADNSYTVELDGAEIHSEPDESNYLEAQVETITIDASALDAGTHTLTFTVKNLAMSGGTQATNPAGLKYQLTIHETLCGDPEPETATIVAHKIVCPVESELPDWGAGSDDITEDTAAEFLAEHPSCHLEPDWQFEWVTDADSNANPGDNSGVAGAPWTLFGPTDGDGSVSADVPAGGKVWVREVLKDGFIPFTGQNTDQNVSAEMYCATDVLNYDNWDWVDPVEAGETYHCVAFNAPKTATVKMCKVDEGQQPLPGWQLTLSGDSVGSVSVEPDGDDYSIEDIVPGSYVVTAEGQYAYRPGAPTASTSDAAFSLRLPGDAVYGGTHAPWTRVNDFPSPHTGWLGVQMNDAFTDWGTMFYPDHAYALATTTDTLGDFVFRILDDVYADNSGSIEVSVAEGYTGVTGDDGCVTFENVPYGTYEIDELMQEGWENVSGLGSVDVDQPEETFTIVNTDEEPPPIDSARVIATKVICDSEEDLPNGSMGKPITAATAADWVAQSNGACRLAEGWEFEWGNQNAGDGGPATIGHAPNYTTFGTTDVNGVASAYVPLAGITTIQMREVLQEGYVPFTNGSNESAEFYCANDAAGYDNWEWISNPQPGETYHCVAFNAPTDPADDGMSSITIVKQSIGGTGTFEINVKDAGPLLPPDPFDWTARITTTVDGVASSSMQYAPPDTYIVEEGVPEGWEFTSVSCTGEVMTTNPLTITISAEEDVVCTFVNTKVDEEEPTEPDEVTVTITGDTAAGENQLGWLFNRDQDTQSPFAFVLGNASIGTGSLFVEPIENDINGASDKFIGELFLLEEIADVDSITYDFKIDAPDDTAEEQFYMSVYMNFGESSPTKFYDCRYSVVPIIGSTGAYTTVTFDPTQTYPVATRAGTEASPHTCPGSPADMDTLGIGSSTIRVIAINAGDSSASDAGVSGYFDRVVVSLSDLITTYDFESAAPSITTNGGGGGGNNSNSERAFLQEVLGATTATCEALLTTFMKEGNPNDAAEVIDLQGFLNEHMSAGIPLTGFFGPMTSAAVHAFQKQYWEDVLAPWFPYPDAGIADADDSTGYVYKTTQWKINDLYCPGIAPSPALP